MWIKTIEQKPEIDQQVLAWIVPKLEPKNAGMDFIVYVGDNENFDDDWFYDNAFCFSDLEVPFWMPKPEPPM